VGDAALALHDLQEQAVVDRIGAEGIVDLEARMPQRAQGARRHALQFGCSESTRKTSSMAEGVSSKTLSWAMSTSR
jgi:hypothetical protein